MKEKIKKYWKIFLLFVIIIILSFLIFGKKYLDNTQTANQYETFFKQIDKNIWKDYFESQKLYLESGRINDELKEKEDYENSDYKDSQRQLEKIIIERWERLKRATYYVNELETGGNSDLEELKNYFIKSIHYNTESAEGDWLRINKIICLLDKLKFKHFFLEECELTKEQELKIYTHGEKWKLGLSEFNKFQETALEKIVSLKSPKCKKCAELILSWTEEKEKWMKEEN